MARRNGQIALEAIRRERWDRWRITIRCPEFQRALRELRRMWWENPDVFHKKYRPLCYKWNLSSIPNKIFTDSSVPDLSLRTMSLYEHFYSASPTTGPVLDAYDDYYGWDDECRPQPGLLPGQRLTLTVDGSYPLDLQLAAVKDQLEQWAAGQPRIKRGYLPPKRQRCRHDAITTQLAVYDLYMNGELTWGIAKKLSKRLGSVKSALRAALILTGAERARHGGSDVPHTQNLMLRQESPGEVVSDERYSAGDDDSTD